MEYSLDEFLLQDSVTEINRIVSETKAPMAGNCLYRHHRNFELHLTNKEILRRNLFKLCNSAKSILEIGFNAGHSCALYLYSNPEIEVVAFDLCSHSYTEDCANYLSSRYNLVLHKGDSGHTIPNYNPGRTFDLIHIDGGHSQIQSLIDIINCKKLADANTLLIVDDTHLAGISKSIEYLRAHGLLLEVDYDKRGLGRTNLHRIFRYNPDFGYAYPGSEC